METQSKQGCQRQEKGNGEIFNVYEFQSCKMMSSGDISPQCEWTQHYWIVHLEMV
jgi:hypothetical protein